MEVNTLIIGHEPLIDTLGRKPREIKHDVYFKELLAQYDLGTVHFASHNDWRSKIDETHPLFIISLEGDYCTREVRECAKDALLYSGESAGSIFARKSTAEKKKEKNRRIFEEVAEHVIRVRENGEKEIEGMRHFASLSYKDFYEMIQKALVSDNEDLKKKAWDLLWGPGEKSSDIIWMRVQMMAEVWEHSKGEQLERLMLMSMEHHLDNGTARKMDDFTDIDGKKYHQYMFLHPLGYDMNYIRRLPYAEKDQDRFAYESLLEKSEIPTNYIRLQLEANQLKQQKEEYIKGECEKISRVLEEWKNNPEKSKKELYVMPWDPEDSADEPLTEKEVESLKNFLKKHQSEELH